MSDDLVKRLRNPPFGTESSERNLMASAADALDTQAAEIARLRAACDASEERERAIELRFWQTVDRDGLTGLPSDMWAALEQLTQDRAALATARREGMEAMAEKIAGWHEAQATEYEAQARKFENLKTISDFTSANPAPDGFQYAVRYAEGAAAHRQRAAAIRAAAKEGER